MTLGLDTSVVVRLLVGHPPEQAATAARRLEEAVDRGHTVVITDLALAEAYHALQHHYAVPKEVARSLLARVASSGVVQVDPAPAVLAMEAEGPGGLLDRLIHVRHRERGAVTWTFDRRQARLEGSVLLSS